MFFVFIHLREMFMHHFRNRRLGKTSNSPSGVVLDPKFTLFGVFIGLLDWLRPRHARTLTL